MPMKNIKTLKKLKDKTVLLRVDWNIPKNHKIKEDTKIQYTLPTIKYLQKNKADQKARRKGDCDRSCVHPDGGHGLAASPHQAWERYLSDACPAPYGLF